MAVIDILLQGLKTNDDHETAIRKLLSIAEIENYLFSLAFVRSNGVETIGDVLRKVSDRIQVFIGIRNGITSVQSIFSLMKIGIYPYVVDTASSKKIFHPKIYAAYNESNAYVILGSANLTYPGLNQNIEASSYITLDREQQDDETYFQDLVTTITSLPVSFPDHIFQVTSGRQAVELLKQGRLEDERFTRLPSTNKAQGRRERDALRPIPTYGRSQPPRKRVKKPRNKEIANTGVLVWESKPLTERSLNIPRGPNTAITGDTNLGKGLMKDIDFQRYFKDEVFSELPWNTEPDSRGPHLERATISAEIVIKGLSYGVHELEVTHDPRTDTRSYEQRNAMTKIKWGDARSFIAKRDLLDRTLRLYKKKSSDYMIVID